MLTRTAGTPRLTEADSGIRAVAPVDRRDADGGEVAIQAARTTVVRDGQQQFGRRLSDLLIAEGLITPEQLGQAVAEQMRTDEKLGPILIRLGLVTEDDLIQFQSRQYKAPVVEVPESGIPAEILKLVPAALARKYEVLPVWRTAGSLTLAMVDPTNLSALDEVSFRTGLRVIPALAKPSVIRKALDQAYGSPRETLADVLSLAAAEAEKLDTGNGKSVGDLRHLRASADHAPVVRLVNGVLEDGIRRGASDIHLDPTETSLRVRIRTDGILSDVMTPPKRLEPAVVSRIKIMAELDIAERRLPQDGRIKFRYHGRDVDLRVSILPTVFGESVTLRILDREALRFDLATLGLDPRGLDHFQRAIGSPHGMIVATGPTGAGKTATLYSALHALNSPDRHIVTLEDPVEYEVRGINQVQVKEDIGLSFAAALRAFLRHDPDVILVGEMRDTETAQIAIRAALTGHLVLTTLHTNDSASTLARLLDMGLPPFLLTASLRLIVAQRLVRKVCAECREPYELEEDRLVPYGHTPHGLGTCVLYRGKGCPACGFTGLKGRVAIFEVLPVTQEIRDVVLDSARVNDLRQVARNQGMRTLREAGLLRVLEGVTTLDEVLRVTAE